MQHKKVNLCVLVLIGIGLTELKAQVAIPATGGNISGIGGSVDYSIGQVVNTAITGANGFVMQGVQQPFEISVLTGTEEAIGINLVCSAYPNPITDFLILKIDNGNNINLSTLTFSLYDINGKLLESKKTEGNETIIPMENLIPSIYFLKVTFQNMEVRIFKITKN
jgi:hypothetical protein